MIEPTLPELTDADVSAIERVSKFDMEKVKFWTAKLEEAQRQVEFWTSAQKVSGALSIRISLTRPPPKKT